MLVSQSSRPVSRLLIPPFLGENRPKSKNNRWPDPQSLGTTYNQSPVKVKEQYTRKGYRSNEVGLGVSSLSYPRIGLPLTLEYITLVLSLWGRETV